MNFVVDGYEVEIKARRVYEKRNNKDAALGFMNSVSTWMHEAARYTAFEHRNDDGFYDGDDEAIEIGKRCGEYLKASSRDLYDQLDAYGCYDDIR